MQKIIGYKINTKDMSVIENILKDLQSNSKKAANILYHKLLSREIENIVDDISLNAMSRPKCSIIELAHKILDQKVEYSSRYALPIEYNLSVTGFLMFGKNNTFLKINCGCKEIEKVIKNHKKLIPIYKSDEENEFDEKMLIKDLIVKYNEYPSIGVNIYQCNEYKIDEKKLNFSSKQDRIERKARHDAQSHLINMYACGKEIQREELMNYMDLALQGLDSYYIKDNIKAAKFELDKILPEITIDLITVIPEEQCVYEKEMANKNNIENVENAG